MFSLMNSTPSSSYSSFSSVPLNGENFSVELDMPNDDPEAHIESDIADQYHYDSVNLSSRSSIPPRPPSRLGFHTSNFQDSQVSSEEATTNTMPPVSHSRSRSATLKWTRSLFQRLGLNTSLRAELVTDAMDYNQKFASSSSTMNFEDEDDNDAEPTTLSILPSAHSVTSSSSSSSSSLGDLEPLVHYDTSFTVYSSDEESDSSDCEESDIDLDSLAEIEHAFPVPYALPPCSLSSPITVPINIPIDSPSSPSLDCASILSPPRVSSLSVSSEAESEEPLPSSKYNCLPSPLSPMSKHRFEFQPQPQRHQYEHRGHSRHSLLYLKWFWAVREEEWAEYAACTDANAYDGISTSPELPVSVRFPSIFSNARTMVPNSRKLWSQPQGELSSPDLSAARMPPMTVHPRWGDVLALRDAWCVHMDRYFVGMPLWTIRKALWMFDVHVMMETGGQHDSPMDHCSAREEDIDDDDISDGHSESLEMSMLGGLSDDSEVTLVESESESEAIAECDSSARETGDARAAMSRVDDKHFYPVEIEEEFFEDVDLNGPETGCSSSSSFRSFSPSSYYSQQKSTSVESLSQSPTLSPPRPSFSRYSYKGRLKRASFKKRQVPWETSWYKRSELLLRITRPDREEERERYEEEERHRSQRAYNSELNSDTDSEHDPPDGISSSTTIARGLGLAWVDDSFLTKNNENDAPISASASRSRAVSV